MRRLLGERVLVDRNEGSVCMSSSRAIETPEYLYEGHLASVQSISVCVSGFSRNDDGSVHDFYVYGRSRDYGVRTYETYVLGCRPMTGKYTHWRTVESRGYFARHGLDYIRECLERR